MTHIRFLIVQLFLHLPWRHRALHASWYQTRANLMLMEVLLIPAKRRRAYQSWPSVTWPVALGGNRAGYTTSILRIKQLIYRSGHRRLDLSHLPGDLFQQIGSEPLGQRNQGPIYFLSGQNNPRSLLQLNITFYLNMARHVSIIEPSLQFLIGYSLHVLK